MKRKGGSLTAEYVAFARAMANAEQGALRVDDPFAKHTLRPLLRGLVALAEQPLIGRAARIAVRAHSFGLVDHLAYRTQAIDDAVREAVDAGATQCVILGAGFDMRAYRLEALAGIDLFEVDHPASQGRKKSLVETLAPRARVRHVAVDFAVDDLSRALDDAGHRTETPTAWIWEGVTMYLPRAAFLHTLTLIGERSAPGSLLAATYFRQAPSPARRAAQRVLRAPLSAIGEPILGAMAREQLHADLGSVGFDVVRDQSDLDWSRARGVAMHPLDAFIGERLAIAARPKNG